MNTNSDVISALHDLIDSGHAVVLADRDAPSHLAKAPIDLRPDAGTRPSGWHAHTTDHAELDRWGHTAEMRGLTLNGGVALTGAYAVVDVDTASAVSAWHDLAESYGETPIPLTVRSPGKQGDDGTWLHRDGGHIYLKIPGHMDFSAFPGTVTLPGDVDVKLHSGWVASPPSVRREGPYEWTGEAVQSFPLWLEDEIALHAPAPRTASTAPDTEFAERVTEWEKGQSWPALLAPLGWTPSGRRDPRCGCDVYQRQGGSSARGGIAHDGTCNRSDSPSFHAFSTGDDSALGQYLAESGTQRATMLRVCALARYDGDMGTCIRTEGLSTHTTRRRPMGVDDLTAMLTSTATPPTPPRRRTIAIPEGFITPPTTKIGSTIAVETFSEPPRGTSTLTAPDPSTTATDPIPTIVHQTPRSKGWDFPEETVTAEEMYDTHILDGWDEDDTEGQGLIRCLVTAPPILLLPRVASTIPPLPLMGMPGVTIDRPFA